MDNIYNDELLPENFEQIAKAYSKSLKNRGFVFVKLEEEEFNLLTSEILILIEKMLSCLYRLKEYMDSSDLEKQLIQSRDLLSQQFRKKNQHKFVCVENENSTFLSLISLENMLILKLMLLSIKSEKFELCNTIITNIASIFAESFSCEGFVLKND